MNSNNELIALSRRRFDHAASRRVLKEKYQSHMLFAYSGGMWKAGPELLTLLMSCAQDKDIVIADSYETPVRVNVPELFAMAHERWQEQMNAWLVEHEELSDKR
jgi:hypothetical protein